MMRHKDLFSGIGGFALAARMVWGEQQKPRLFCEKEPYARRVLSKNFPGVLCVEDIRNLRGDSNDTTDIVTAGFPCQPFSVAGKRAGQQDDRYLWPETLRFLQEDQPRWFIGENVPGIINLALDDVLASLESAGYETETLIIPACAVNAPHKRERVWIVAHATRECSHRSRDTRETRRHEFTDGCSDVADANDQRELQPQRGEREFWRRSGDGGQTAMPDADKQYDDGCGLRAGEVSQQHTTGIPIGQQWESEPGICGVADGVSHRVERLRGLGNAIVPQVAAVIMAAIRTIEEGVQ